MATTTDSITQARLKADLLEQRNRVAVAQARARVIKENARAIAAASGRMRSRLDRLTAQDSRVKEMRDVFENARRTRLRPGAAPMGGAGFYHLPRTDRLRLAAESQHLRRNNWVARAVVKRLCDLVAADGGTWSVNSKDASWNDRAQRMLTDWADARKRATLGHPDIRGRHPFWRQIRQNIQTACTDGDLLIIKRVKGGVGRLQVVEGERIGRLGQLPGTPAAKAGAVQPGTDGPAVGNSIVDGVEIDADGEPAAFHIADWGLGGSAPTMQTRRIDAAQCLYLTNPMDDELGMVRGEPALSSQIDRLEFLDLYIENTGLAAEIATRFGLVITSERPGEMQSAFEAANESQIDADTGKPREVDLPQARALFLKAGESATQIDPKQPNTNAREFILLLILLSCAEMGVPLSAAFFEGSGLSWANIKALLAIAGAGLSVWQDWCVGDTAVPIAQWKIREWIDAGRLPENPEFDEVSATMPAMPVLDFPTAVAGYKEAVAGLLMPQEEATRQLGMGRYMDVLKRRAAEVKAEKAAGVSPVQMPGAGGGPHAGAASNSTPDPANDPTQDPAANPSADPNADPAAA